MGKHNIKILYFMQLPPPVHGVSTINEFIWKSIFVNRDFEKHLLQIRFSDRLDNLRRVNIRKVFMFFRLRKDLIRKILELQPDLVYISFMPVGKGFLRDFFFALAIKRLKVKQAYHLHNRGIRKRHHRYVYIRLISKIFNDSLIIHVSRTMLDEEIRPLDLLNARMSSLPNAVPLIRSVQPIRDHNNIRILFVSNLFPAKGIYNIIRIFKPLAEKYKNIELCILGDFMRKRHKIRFYRLLKSAGLIDRVYLPGAKYGKEKWEEYRKADIFLFPSGFAQECMPLVILEAMQFALPVVASDIGAISDMIKHKTNGFLLKPDDIRMFAESLELLINDKKMREEMGRIGRELFLGNFTLNIFEERLRKIVQDYLSINE